MGMVETPVIINQTSQKHKHKQKCIRPKSKLFCQQMAIILHVIILLQNIAKIILFHREQSHNSHV